jgi:hypothetical protein
MPASGLHPLEPLRDDHGGRIVEARWADCRHFPRAFRESAGNTSLRYVCNLWIEEAERRLLQGSAKHHSSGTWLRFQPRSAFYSSVQERDWPDASRRSTVFVSSDAFANSTPKGYANKAATPAPYLPLPRYVCLLASKACLSCLPGTREASQTAKPQCPETERWAVSVSAPMRRPSKSELRRFQIMDDGSCILRRPQGSARVACRQEQ